MWGTSHWCCAMKKDNASFKFKRNWLVKRRWPHERRYLTHMLDASLLAWICITANKLCGHYVVSRINQKLLLYGIGCRICYNLTSYHHVSLHCEILSHSWQFGHLVTQCLLFQYDSCQTFIYQVTLIHENSGLIRSWQISLPWLPCQLLLDVWPCGAVGPGNHQGCKCCWRCWGNNISSKIHLPCPLIALVMTQFLKQEAWQPGGDLWNFNVPWFLCTTWT